MYFEACCLLNWEDSAKVEMKLVVVEAATRNARLLINRDAKVEELLGV